MIGVTRRQSWLFFQPMAQQVSLLKDDLLDPVDALLADAELVHLVRTCLAGRRPQSTRTGRDGIAPDRLLRCCVLKHLKGWSFECCPINPLRSSIASITSSDALSRRS